MNDATPGLGHNQPPPSAPPAPEVLKEEIEQRYAELFDKMERQESAADTIPERIEEADAGKVQELVKMMRVAIADAKSRNKIEKDPWSNAGKVVDGVFKTRIERLERSMRTALDRLNDFLHRKAEAERIEREERLRKQREETERLAREAEEAERRKREAEEAKRRAEEEARAAEELRQRRLREAQEAEARARAAKAEEARLKEERARRKAEEAAAVAKKREADREAADRAKAMAAARADEERQLAALRAKRKEEEEAARKAREAAAAEKAKRDAAEEQARKERESAREANREMRTAEKSWERTEAQANRTSRSLGSTDADMARTRSELGAVGTLAERWTFEVEDYAILRSPKVLQQLAPFLQDQQLHAAVSRFMQAGGRELAGVRFEKQSEARVI